MGIIVVIKHMKFGPLVGIGTSDSSSNVLSYAIPFTLFPPLSNNKFLNFFFIRRHYNCKPNDVLVFAFQICNNLERNLSLFTCFCFVPRLL